MIITPVCIWIASRISVLYIRLHPILKIYHDSACVAINDISGTMQKMTAPMNYRNLC